MVTTEEINALPEELRELHFRLGCMHHQWEKGRDFGYDGVLEYGNKILAYLDEHEDCRWLRSLVYRYYSQIYDVHPLETLWDEMEAEHAEYEKEQQRIAALPSWRRLLHNMVKHIHL